MHAATPFARPHVASRGGRCARPGVTFLEAVFATLLLGMIAATLSGVSAALRRGDERERQMLGAAEMASRLIIIQNDDPTMMPQPGLPVWYGPEGSSEGFFYRWSLNERAVRVALSEAGQEVAASRTSGSDFSKRVKVITVNVWLSEDSGGAFAPADGIPRATVSRLIDTLGFHNPDRDNRALQQENGLEDIMQRLLEASGTSEGGVSEGISIGTEQLPRSSGGGQP